MNSEKGDTLIEVTIALAILSFVLISSTAIASAAFRMGETATERIQIANVAQEQMEALRSFRDNNDNGTGGNTWANTFEPDINTVNGGSGFHMQLVSGSNTAWVPVAGSLTSSSPGSLLTDPTASVQISSATPFGDQGCGYAFLLTYKFTPLGGNANTPDQNRIATTLVNLKYSHNPALGPAPCPQ
jgi:type II secretory pathway pseudopilin PulG